VATDVFMEDFEVRLWAPSEGMWAATDLTWVAVLEPGVWGATIACHRRVVDRLDQDEAFDVVPASTFPEREVLARVVEAG
jgi:hypothetical protein